MRGCECFIEGRGRGVNRICRPWQGTTARQHLLPHVPTFLPARRMCVKLCFRLGEKGGQAQGQKLHALWMYVRCAAGYYKWCGGPPGGMGQGLRSAMLLRISDVNGFQNLLNRVLGEKQGGLIGSHGGTRVGCALAALDILLRRCRQVVICVVALLC